MAREMYLVGVSEEELKPTPKAEPPRTPKEKWSNIWYHYKWLIIGGAFGIIALAVLIGQTLSVNRPDYTVIVMTKAAYPDMVMDPFSQFLEKYGQDIDGDGEVEVQTINCFMGDQSSQSYYTNSQVMQAHLVAGDVMLYAFEPAYLKQYCELLDRDDLHFLTDLEVESDGLSEDRLSWNWNGDSRVTGDVVLSTMPQDLCFGVRTAIGTAEESVEMQKQCLDLLYALIQNTPRVTEK